MNVAIVGGGITGLTAAFRLSRAGVPVTVYEASPRTGGVIETTRADGFLAESGPNTLLETSPVVGDLVRDLGLEPKRLYSDPEAKNRYVVRNGRPTPVPDTAAGMFTSKLFSAGAKFRLLTEPFVGRAAPHLEESVAQFVLRRLGREFLDYAINPMIAGIYAGDPARLSVTQAFPKLHALEQRYGSLILGQILGARERARSKEISKQSAPKFSFPEGLQTLTDALHHELIPSVRLRSSVRTIRQTPNGWELDVSCDGGEMTSEHDAVLLAGTAHKLAEIRLETSRNLSLAPLGEIPYAPVASLVLGFRREDVEHPLDGFGVLVPEVEHLNILGVIFSSSLFPGRAPAGHVTISCYVGGLRAPALAALDTKSIVELVLSDLRTLLGVRGRPVFVQHSVFPEAIPQYEVGFGRFREFMNSLEENAPGLFLAGHYRDGISLSDSIVSGDKAAGRLGVYVAGRTLISRSRKAVLLVNLGSPDSPSVPDVRRYLREFLMDGRVLDTPWPIRFCVVNFAILPSRPKESAHAYSSVWTPEGSPLVVTSRHLQAGLQRRLGIPVELAMRYQNPSIDSAVARLAAQGIQELLLIPLFPHYAMSSFETAVERVKEAVAKQMPSAKLLVQPPFHNLPEYIDALVASAKEHLSQPYDHLLFSFHGLPERHMRKADQTGCHCLKVPDCCEVPSPAHATCYRAQCFKTVKDFVARAGLAKEKYSVAFQSRLGREPWLQPYTDKEVERFAQAGIKRMLVICPAFVSDCLETIEEIGMRARASFQAAGGEKLTLIPCLNEHPAWLSALEQMVTHRWPGAASGELTKNVAT